MFLFINNLVIVLCRIATVGQYVSLVRTIAIVTVLVLELTTLRLSTGGVM